MKNKKKKIKIRKPVAKKPNSIIEPKKRKLREEINKKEIKEEIK